MQAVRKGEFKGFSTICMFYNNNEINTAFRWNLHNSIDCQDMILIKFLSTPFKKGQELNCVKETAVNRHNLVE